MTRAPLAAALLLWASLSGCGPVGPLPGFALAGERAAEPVEDWSFSDRHLEIQVETRGRWLPHSVTTICMAAGGKLYVPSRNASQKTWVANALRDPRVRVRVGGRIHELRAVRVTDAAELEPVARTFLRKYYGVGAEQARVLVDPPAPGDERADLWVFRMDPLGEGGAG